MRNKITALAVLTVTFLALAGMSAGPGCDCSAHARTNVQTAK